MSFWSRNQLAVTVVAFVGFTGFTLVMPFLALYFQELGVTGSSIAVWTGITLGVTPAVTAVCAPLWGRVGDRFGNKILVQRSLVSFVGVMWLMAYATKPWHVFALRAIQGLVAGYGPLTVAMAALSAPRHEMARAIGTVQTAQRIAPAIGPVIGGVLASTVGLRNSFLVSAVVYAAALVLLTALYKDPKAGAVDGAAAGRVTFASILAFQNFVLLMLVVGGLQLVDRSFGPVLVLFLGDLGYASAEATLVAGALFSILALSGAVGNQVAAGLLRRRTARVVIAGAVLVAAGSLALFAAAASALVLAGSMALFGLGVGTAMTAAFTAAGAVIPRHAHSVSFGFLSGASLMGSAISPALSGLVAAHSIRVVFVAGVVVLAVLAFVVRRVMVEQAVAVERTPTVPEE